MKQTYLLKRYLIFLAGLFISSLGVSFVTKASLGTSPISSIPYTLSLGFTPTLGQFTIAFSVLLIAMQVALLRKNFKKEQLLQIPVSILFGYFIDFTMLLLQFLTPSTYILKLLSLLCGCMILGFGVYLEVLADVVMLPGEAFVKAVSSTFHTEFGTTKVVFDGSMTVIAGILSFFLFHRLEGVREGTIIAALIVGMIARFFNKKLHFVEPYLFPNTVARQENVSAEISSPGYVITIARELGSGGHQIGKMLSEKLGFSFYDRDIIHMTAKKSGLPENYIETHEQKMTNSLLYDIATQGYAFEKDELPPLEALFEAEKKVIQEIARTGNCIIVGRCADFVLADRPDCLRVFIHSDLPHRTARIMDDRHLDEKSAKELISKTDRERASHYKRNTGKFWGNVSNYDLTIDSGKLGIEKCVEMIQIGIEG